MKKTIKAFQNKIQSVTNLVLLLLVYFVGIGPTSLLGRLMEKKFLNLSPKGSSWQKFLKKHDPEKMY